MLQCTMTEVGFNSSKKKNQKQPKTSHLFHTAELLDTGSKAFYNKTGATTRSKSDEDERYLERYPVLHTFCFLRVIHAADKTFGA